MTATKFFALAREHEQELCRLIDDFCPQRQEIDLYAGGVLTGMEPRNAFKTALNARQYPVARGILQSTFGNINFKVVAPTPTMLLCAEMLDSISGVDEMTKTENSVKKFYVGSENIAEAFANGLQDGHMYHSIDAAIAEAKARIKEGKKNYMIVVEVKRLVKRANPEPPIIVEEV